MVVCRFFQQGCCRYGDNCRFEHPQKAAYYSGSVTTKNDGDNITLEQLLNQVLPEVTVAIKSKQWLLSCYGPFKNKGNFPGFIDISPEEIRLFTYEAQANGTLSDYLNQLRNIQQNVIKNMQAMLKPSPSITNTIQNLYRGEPISDPFDSSGFQSFGTSPNNIFGNNVQNSNLGGMNAFNSGQNVFQSSPNMFAPVPTNPPIQANSYNIFNTQIPSANAFGDSTFNATAPFSNPSNIFNNSQMNNGNALFSSNTSNFGLPAQIEVSPSALFANANAQLPNDTQTNVFSSSNSAVVNKEIYQNPFETASSNIFAMNKVNSPFGINASPQFDNEEIFSRIEDLKKEDTDAFEQGSFQFGFIPEVAPAFSMCM